MPRHLRATPQPCPRYDGTMSESSEEAGESDGRPQRGAPASRMAWRDVLERHQIWLYLAAVILAIPASRLWPDPKVFEPLINPALALMLFVTFLQVPLVRLGAAFLDGRFLAALGVANFIAVPLLVAGLAPLLPAEPLVLLGVLFVLLVPCVDYVVTFSHLGRSDAQALLAATPLLLLLQMLLLPVYLGLLAGDSAAALVTPKPFLHAFVILIALPLALACVAQVLAARSRTMAAVVDRAGLWPVPATAVVLFVVVAAVLPQLGAAAGSVLAVLPVYMAFAVLAPFAGWGTGRLFGLQPAQTRALAFSAATRNSLVVLPLALAVPGALPVVPAVIVTQTLVELLAELIYIRVIPRLIRCGHR